MRAIETLDLDTLALGLDNDGPEAHQAELRAVAARALGVGISPTLVRILASADAPAAARQRAYGRVAALLAATDDHGHLARAS